MRILLWHVHGSWATAFVQGQHDYLVPVLPDRGPDGRGRARTWDWPASVVEMTPEELKGAEPDLVLLQRPHEAELLEQWTGLRVGRDVPAVYVEHDTPLGDVPATRHPLADRSDVPVVHVTHFNRLMWDCGRAPTAVVEHGVPDPGHRWTGELARSAVLVNEPVRRGRTVGTDLLPAVAGAGGLDVFGMGVDALEQWWPGGAPADLALHEDVPQAAMHAELARRRVYVHTARWTSLGLSLIEAMMLGMPVVALASTEAPRLVTPACGAISADVGELTAAVEHFLADQDAARAAGESARRRALELHSVERFLADWDTLLAAVTA
jgi:hypothetical protein